MKNDDFSTSTVEKLFPQNPQVSFDHGVLEKSQDLILRKSYMDWTDIGGYNSLAEFIPENNKANRIKGENLVSLNSTNNVVWRLNVIFFVAMKK